MNWFLLAFQRFSDFHGRSRRKEYWMFFLFNLLFSAAIVIVDDILGFNEGFGFLYVLYGLLVFIPSLALTVRRLHDIGKSGWMLLVSLIPLIGSIWLFILLVTEGDPHPNRYGPDPKQEIEEDQQLFF